MTDLVSMTAPDTAERHEPRVCVVIPAWNAAVFIAETLDSVFAQTYTNYEIAVINDGSPDTQDLERVLAPYMDRIRYIRRPNGGPSAARNAAIRTTTADLVAMLDSDDIWEPNCLFTQVTYLQQHPETDMVYGDAVFFGRELAGRRYMELFPSEGEVTFEALISRRCHVMVSVLCRRKALLAAGLFDESLRRCEDLDLWCRLIKSGHRIGYHRNILMRYRRYQQSLSSESSPMLKALVCVYVKFRRTLDLSTAERSAVEAQLNHSQAEIFFFEGKDAFINGDFSTSVEKLTAANAILRQRRLRFVTRLIQFCPRLLHWAYVSRRHA